MPIQASNLVSVIEVNIAPAIAALQQYDSAQKQTAQSAQASGDAIKQAFTNNAQPIQATAKEVTGLGARLREVVSDFKEFGGGLISGAAAEIRSHFRQMEESAKKAGNEVAAGAEKAKKGIGDTGKAASANSKDFQGYANNFKLVSDSIGSVGRGDLSKIPGLMDAFRGSMGAAAGEAGGLAAALGPVGVTVAAVVGAVAGAGAVAGFFLNLAKEGSELGGQMLDLSLNTGIAAEALSRYKIQAEQSGSSVETVAGAIEKLERKLQDAASGDEKLGRVFKALSVDIKAAGEDPQGAFEQLAEKIASIEDPLLRVKAATEVFGRSGANLISTFVTMKQDSDALKVRMAELGLTMTNDVAAGADRIGDEFVILNAVSDSLKVKVANETAPAIVASLQSIENSLSKLEPAISGTANFFLGAFSPVVDTLSTIASLIDSISNKKPPASLVPQSLAGAISSFGEEGAGSGNKLTPTYLGTTNKGPVSGKSKAEKIFDEQTKPFAAEDPYTKLRKAFVDNKRRGGSKGSDSIITPADTFSSTKQLRDAELGLEETQAKAAIAITKAEADERRKILDAQFADNLTSARNYFDQRRAIEAGAIDREIAEQQRIIQFEERRIALAEEDTQKEIKRINDLEDAQRKKAKTPAQRNAIEEDRANKILNAENQLAAERDRHSQKQIEAEAKITELQSKRAGQIASTSRDEIKANKALESSFQDLIDRARDATSNSLTDAGTAAGKKFADSLALAIREGRGDVQAAIETLTAVEANKKAIESSEKRQSVLQSGLDLEQVRIQADYNEGLISEVTARRENIAAQAQFRDAIIKELEIQQKRAEAISDYVTAARLEVEIEKKKREGKQLDPHIKSLGDSLTHDFDQLQADLESGQKKLSEALRDFGRSFVTDILHEVQSSIVENLTHEKSIGAALGKGIAKKLGGLFDIGKDPNAPGAPNDPVGLIIKNFKENSTNLGKDIASLSGKTTDAIRNAADHQSQVLEKIATSNADMASCACAPAQGPSLLGQVLGAVVGAVGAGIGGMRSGGGGNETGGFKAPAKDYFVGSHGVPMRIGGKADGGMVFPYDAGGMCDGGHVGMKAGYAAVGRFIQGPGTSRSDSIPMWLSDGEYVTDADTVKALGPQFFKALPAFARAGKMADGGSVSSSSMGSVGNGMNMGPLAMPRPSSSQTSSSRAGQLGSSGDGKTINNHITINVQVSAPTGSVTPQTRQQMAMQSGLAVQAALARSGNG
jgi:hypothetical protein